MLPRLSEVANALGRVHISEARHESAALLRRWGGTVLLADGVTFVVSELATHPVEHNRGTASRRSLRRGDEPHGEARDDNPAPARLRPYELRCTADAVSYARWADHPEDLWPAAKYAKGYAGSLAAALHDLLPDEQPRGWSYRSAAGKGAG